MVRLNLVYGSAVGPRAFGFDRMLAAAEASGEIPLFTDEFRSPVSVVDAARALRELARTDHAGILRLGGPEPLTRYELGRRILHHRGLDDRARPSSIREFRGIPRSPDTVFDGHRAREILTAPPRPLDDSLDAAFAP